MEFDVLLNKETKAITTTSTTAYINLSRIFSSFLFSTQATFLYTSKDIYDSII